MIPVVPQPEPEDFDERVRQPGQTAVAAGRKPLPAYWRRCLTQLWNAYGRVCAYSCLHIPAGTGARTVDHYRPKSAQAGPPDEAEAFTDTFVRQDPDPDHAYEWQNYRLACSQMNSRKRDFVDVLDPFEVEDGWFRLEFVFGGIFADPDLDEERQDRVRATIDRLGLDDSEWREARMEWLGMYERGLSFNDLSGKSPLVALELERQALRRDRDID